jgi:hypothetical protein
MTLFENDGEIDYSIYTREQLLDALQNIDADSYPINAANLKKRLAELGPGPPPPPPPPPVIADPPTALGSGSFLDRLEFVGREVQALPQFHKDRPNTDESLGAYGAAVVPTLSLLFREEEVFVLLLLQWATIGLGYLLWVQGLYWIPEEIWRAALDSKAYNAAADIFLLVWSFACVGLVAFPLGLLSACIAAVEILRRTGHRASLAACLRLVTPRTWAIWMFTWADAWITVNQILDRLPKKSGNPSWATRMAEEAAYYAWKVGSAGVLPSLIVGHDLLRAGKDSVSLLRHRFRDVMALRTGYSVLCWIVGISAYVGTIIFFRAFPQLIPHDEPLEQHIGDIYFWAAVPIAVATGIVVVFLRPIYLFGLCDLYVAYHESTGKPMELPQLPSRLVSALTVFLALAAIVAVVFVYRSELGILQWIGGPGVPTQ